MAPDRTRTHYPSWPLRYCHENATSTLHFRDMWFCFLITQIIHNCYYISWKLKKNLKRKGKDYESASVPVLFLFLLKTVAGALSADPHQAACLSQDNTLTDSLAGKGAHYLNRGTALSVGVVSLTLAESSVWICPFLLPLQTMLIMRIFFFCG